MFEIEAARFIKELSAKKRESAENRPLNTSLQRIEEHLGHAELGSTRFQAFADYVDREYANYLSSALTRDGKVKLYLIEETIRQRENGVVGYKMELQEAERLAKNLERALVDAYPPRPGARQSTPVPLQRVAHLQAIKTRAIIEKSSQAQQPEASQAK